MKYLFNNMHGEPFHMRSPSSAYDAGVRSSKYWEFSLPGGPPSYSLREATITVISSTQCSQMYNKTDRQHLNKGIVESQLCAGNPEGGVDSCQVSTISRTLRFLKRRQLVDVPASVDCLARSRGCRSCLEKKTIHWDQDSRERRHRSRNRFLTSILLLLGRQWRSSYDSRCRW